MKYIVLFFMVISWLFLATLITFSYYGYYIKPFHWGMGIAASVGWSFAFYMEREKEKNG